MEQAIVKQETAEGELNFSRAVWELREAVHRRLIDKGVGRLCNVIVHQKGTFLELSGTVDSEWTHAEILAMLPDEERCIADNIQVIPPLRSCPAALRA
jgi:hypothetical protein